VSGSEVVRQWLQEQVKTGKRLGRHLFHDSRSIAHPSPMAPSVVTVHHERRVAIFNQGELGSCTGNAGAGMMCTGPFGKEDLTEDDAVRLYSEATHLDNIYGAYPPKDTGSSGLAIMKALVRRGWIKAYAHAFGLDHFLRSLVLRPGIVGVGWREGCDEPDAEGLVSYTGELRGGHEIEALGIDAERGRVIFANSWGEEWGAKGFFSMTFADVKKALKDGGDATFAIPH
jgi:hypothetical protein